MFTWLFPKRVAFPDLSQPLLYLRLAGRIERLKNARPDTASLDPINDPVTVGYEGGYMAAIVDVLKALLAEQGGQP